MIELLVVIAGLASIFVGFNIGGSSTGIAWGPPVGAGIVSKSLAAILMTFFVFLGGWTVGRNVMDTLSNQMINIDISLTAGTAVLFFIGAGILTANIFSVPVPTSMTTVGSIVGLGLATESVNTGVILEIVTWWIVTPVIGLWIGGLIGRYIYPEINARVRIQKSDGPLLELENSGLIPKPTLGPNTTQTELISTLFVILVGCYMSFSAGASNIPNAAAPLVGGAGINPSVAIIMATLAIGVGAFTIARRTMKSVGGELSDIPLLAALFVMVTASSITTVLSILGIPISLVMATVMTIVGIGWGRATRPVQVSEFVRQDTKGKQISLGAITAESEEGRKANPIGRDEHGDALEAGDLFNPYAIIKYVSMWIIGPSISTLLSYGFFSVYNGLI